MRRTAATSSSRSRRATRPFAGRGRDRRHRIAPLEPLEPRIVLDGGIALDSGVAQGAVYTGGFVAVPSSVQDDAQLDAYLATHPIVAAPAFDATFSPVAAGTDGQYPIGSWMADGPNSDWIAPAIHGQSSAGLAPFVDTGAGYSPDSSAPQGLFYYYAGKEVPQVGQAFQPDIIVPSGWKA